MRLQGPGSNEIEQSYWLRAIHWTYGLQTRVQDKKKWQIEANLHGTIVEEKAIGSDPLNKFQNIFFNIKN